MLPLAVPSCMFASVSPVARSLASLFFCALRPLTLSDRLTSTQDKSGSRNPILLTDLRECSSWSCSIYYPLYNVATMHPLDDAYWQPCCDICVRVCSTINIRISRALLLIILRIVTTHRWEAGITLIGVMSSLSPVAVRVRRSGCVGAAAAAAVVVRTHSSPHAGGLWVGGSVLSPDGY